MCPMKSNIHPKSHCGQKEGCSVGGPTRGPAAFHPRLLSDKWPRPQGTRLHKSALRMTAETAIRTARRAPERAHDNPRPLRAPGALCHQMLRHAATNTGGTKCGGGLAGADCPARTTVRPCWCPHETHTAVCHSEAGRPRVRVPAGRDPPAVVLLLPQLPLSRQVSPFRRGL